VVIGVSRLDAARVAPWPKGPRAQARFVGLERLLLGVVELGAELGLDLGA